MQAKGQNGELLKSAAHQIIENLIIENEKFTLLTNNNSFKNINYSGVLISSGKVIKGKRNLVTDFIINSNPFSKNNLNNKTYEQRS